MTTLQQVKEVGEFTANISHLNKMCDKIKETPKKVYEIAAEYGTPFAMGDSYMRETIFSYIADKFYDGDYSKIYNRWIGA